MRIFWLAFSFLAFGCGTSKIEDRLAHEPSDKGPPPYAFKSTFPDVMEFEQGLEYRYDLFGSVQVPEGHPVLFIENLPEGAVFDGKFLTWLPRCDLPTEFFEHSYGLHYVRIHLKSSVDSHQFVERRAVLLVHKFKEYPDRKCEDVQG